MSRALQCVVLERAEQLPRAPRAASEPFDVERIRRDFPILATRVNGRPLVYLDNAATTQKPRAVIEAIVRYYETTNANIHRGVYTLSQQATSAVDKARETVARFLSASEAAECIFVRGVTEAINLVAMSWGRSFLEPGDEVLLTALEHHSNIVPWQMLAERVGAQVIYLPVNGDQGMLNQNHLDEFLTKDVKLFAMTHISNTLGTVNPVAAFCARARKNGTVTLVDAAQSAGHRRVDVQEIDCDFLVLSGHKMCGPTGIGVFYGRAAVLDQMAPFQGGGEMILEVDFQRTAYKKAPHRFEAGTPDISGAIGLHAAMDYLDAIGRDNIAQHDQELGAYALEKLLTLKGLRIFGPNIGRAGLVSFLLDGIHAHDVVTVADQRGVALRGGHHCNQPLMKKLGVPATARASFYIYNTQTEIDRFVEVVRDIQKFFA